MLLPGRLSSLPGALPGAQLFACLAHSTAGHLAARAGALPLPYDMPARGLSVHCGGSRDPDRRGCATGDRSRVCAIEVGMPRCAGDAASPTTADVPRCTPLCTIPAGIVTTAVNIADGVVTSRKNYLRRQWGTASVCAQPQNGRRTTVGPAAQTNNSCGTARHGTGVRHVGRHVALRACRSGRRAGREWRGRERPRQGAAETPQRDFPIREAGGHGLAG